MDVVVWLLWARAIAAKTSREQPPVLSMFTAQTLRIDARRFRCELRIDEPRVWWLLLQTTLRRACVAKSDHLTRDKTICLARVALSRESINAAVDALLPLSLSLSHSLGFG